MELIEPLQTHLEQRMDHYLHLLREMVAINSFTANAGGVNQLGRMTAGAFAPLGFEAEHIPSTRAEFGNHLVLTRPGRTKHTVGLVSHLDTVFPAAEERENDFRWREAGNKIYGPGTVDIKGGTVVIYMMMEALSHVMPDFYDDVNWVILLDASEEVDGAQFGEIVRDRLVGNSPLACLIFEGGRINWRQARVVTARKGRAIYHVRAEGKAAHAGTAHEEGANAIVQLAEAITEIANFTDYGQAITFNVGTVAGGTVVNRVPHEAAATVEMRAFHPDVYEAGVKRMMSLPAEFSVASGNGNYPCRLEVEILDQTRPWPRNDATERLFALWREAGAALGIEVDSEARGGLSDGNYFWDVLPTLDGLGPSGGNAHCSQQSDDGSKEQEFVRRESLVPCALLNSVALWQLWQSDGGSGR